MKVVAILENSGVYCWLNLRNNKRYIGSSVDLAKRFRYYSKVLAAGECHNPHLQAAWLKYGSQAFDLSVLEYCAAADRLGREQFWIHFYRVADRRFGYNCSPTAGSVLGMKWSAESRARLSELAKNPDPTWKANRMAAMARPETKAKMSVSQRGRKHSAESRAKISASKKGQPNGRLGVKLSSETKAKIGARHRGKVVTPESIEKMRRSLTGRRLTQQHRANISAGLLRGRYNRAEESA